MKGIRDFSLLKRGLDILFSGSEPRESLAIICDKVDKPFPITTKNFYRIRWHVIEPGNYQAGKKKAVPSDFKP